MPNSFLHAAGVSRHDTAGGSLHRPGGNTAAYDILLDTLLQALLAWHSW